MDNMNATARSGGSQILVSIGSESGKQTCFVWSSRLELVDLDELQYVVHRDQKNTSEQYVGHREKFLALAHRILAELDPTTVRILESLGRIEKMLEKRLPSS